MKVDIVWNWTDEQLAVFDHLKEKLGDNKSETYTLDLDYAEDENDIISGIVDEIYRRHQIVIGRGSTVRECVKDYESVVSAYFCE